MTLERLKAWDARKRAAGLCRSCGKERGPDGTRRFCRKHADRHNEICRLTRKMRWWRQEQAQ